MSHYTCQTTVNAPADEVFAYVTNVERMPEYLPTLHEAHRQGEDRVAMKGEAAGHPYSADGNFVIDQDGRTMRWSSDGEHRYSGHLEVQDQGSACNVSVTLDFEPNPGMDEDFKREMGSRDAAIQDGLEKSLQSIKNQCEGTGGKVPTRADGDRGYLG